MSMLDTVHLDGLEWLTKSTVPHSGGMAGDYEIKDDRLWLTPWDVGADDKHKALPPEDANFHGILELFRNLPSVEGAGKHRAEHKRLIFVAGQLLSETSATCDVESDSGWQGDWKPTDPRQNLVWQLHTLRGLLTTINAHSATTAPEAMASLKLAETSISEALSHLEP